jgi:hypothetical protein
MPSLLTGLTLGNGQSPEPAFSRLFGERSSPFGERSSPYAGLLETRSRRNQNARPHSHAARYYPSLWTALTGEGF